jgi:hypothetical protein
MTSRSESEKNFGPKGDEDAAPQDGRTRGGGHAPQHDHLTSPYESRLSPLIPYRAFSQVSPSLFRHTHGDSDLVVSGVLDAVTGPAPLPPRG